MNSFEQPWSGKRGGSSARSISLRVEEYNNTGKRIQRAEKVSNELLSALQLWNKNAVQPELEKTRLTVNAECLLVGNVAGSTSLLIAPSARERDVSKECSAFAEELKALSFQSAMLQSFTEFYDKAFNYA